VVGSSIDKLINIQKHIVVKGVNNMEKKLIIPVLLFVFMSVAFATNPDNIDITTTNATATYTISRTVTSAQNTSNPLSSQYVSFYSTFSIQSNSETDDNITSLAYRAPDVKCVNSTSYKAQLYNGSDLTTLLATAVAQERIAGQYLYNFSLENITLIGNSVENNFTVLFYCAPLDSYKTETYTDIVHSDTIETIAKVNYTALANLTYSNVTIVYLPRQWSSLRAINYVNWNGTSTSYTRSGGITVSGKSVVANNNYILEINYLRDRGYTQTTKTGTGTRYVAPTTPAFRIPIISDIVDWLAGLGRSILSFFRIY